MNLRKAKTLSTPISLEEKPDETKSDLGTSWYKIRRMIVKQIDGFENAEEQLLALFRETHTPG
jgi:DNA-directed RNA polymerase subunit N (RpoN/RPB10)